MKTPTSVRSRSLVIGLLGVFALVGIVLVTVHSPPTGTSGSRTPTATSAHSSEASRRDTTNAESTATGSISPGADNAAPPAESSPGHSVRVSAASRNCSKLELESPRPGAQQIADAIVALEARTRSQIQLSWYDPQSSSVVAVGSRRAMVAWSTIKVPIALAVIEQGNGSVYRSQISSAIQQSDNAAAEMLWRSLGSEDQARAAAVTGVLRGAGDDTTHVPNQQLHPPFSVFGQTAWHTTEQVRFLIEVPCRPGGDGVVKAMSSVTSAQRWGMGSRPGASFKGGWGPTSGGYAARQMGWFRPPGSPGDIVAAVSVIVPDGSLQDAIFVLDDAQDLLADDHLR